MEKNNGKIAIAIVAMFVVALSVVGFTYAYFTASVQGNTNKSVEVKAGILEIEYETGGKVIDAGNIVPGWESNGKYYYDPVASVFTLEDNTKGIRAVSIDACTVGSAFPGSPADQLEAACDAKYQTSDYGLIEPASFSIKNTSRNTGETMYAIKLNVSENGIAANHSEDKDNLTVSLYRSSRNTGENTDIKLTGGTLVGTTHVLPEANDYVYLTPTEETLAATNTEEDVYYVVMSYANVDSDQSKGDETSEISTAQNIKAMIEIVPLAKAISTYTDTNNVEVAIGDLVDADGNKVFLTNN